MSLKGQPQTVKVQYSAVHCSAVMQRQQRDVRPPRHFEDYDVAGMTREAPPAPKPPKAKRPRTATRGTEDAMVPPPDTAGPSIPPPVSDAAEGVVLPQAEPEPAIGRPTEVRYTTVEGGTQRGGTLLVDSDGYSYTVKRSGPTHTHYRCAVKRKDLTCLATVKQTGNDYTPGPHPHSHNGEGSGFEKMVRAALVYYLMYRIHFVLWG